MAAINLDEVKEVLPFLSTSARTDLKVIALQYFLGLTGSEEGRQFIQSDIKYLSAIVGLTADEQTVIAKDAYLALVNLSTEAVISQKLLGLEREPELAVELLQYILKTNSDHADIACALLNNLSRSEECAEKFVQLMIERDDDIGFNMVIQAFCKEKYNPKAKLHHLGPFLANLSQIQEARRCLLDKKRCVVQRLLPYVEYKDSLTRRGGIVSILRNCCFEVEYHEWLLGNQVDLLPRLLLPLTGPEEFDEDDMERLPEDLQYLEPDKQRESDPDLRKLLVECVYQLCATKPCRRLIKDKNIYVVLRALHMWEKDPAARLAEENLIHLLIGDEPEPGMENLREVEVPEAVGKKLEEEQQRQLEEEEEEEELRTEGEGKEGEGASGDTGAKT